MNKSLLIASALALATSLGAAQAQTYQWKDASGKTVISDTPPPAGVREKRALGTRQPPVVTGSAEPAPATAAAAETTNSAPLTTAEKEIEFRKRQQEAREKAEKDAKEAAARKEKRETCERARNNYRMLQSDTPVNQAGKDGELKPLDGNQRRQEMERTRRIMQEACK